MAWNQQLRKTPEESLNTVRNWEKRGLTYWQGEVEKATARMKACETSQTLGRAIFRMRLAEEAVRRLS